MTGMAEGQGPGAHRPSLAEAKAALEIGHHLEAVRLSLAVARATREPDILAQALHLCGFAYLAAHEIERAISYFRRSMLSQPARPSVYANLATSVGSGGTTGEASVSLAGRALLLAPKSGMAWLAAAHAQAERARILRAKHDFASALLASKRALAISPDDSEAMFGAMIESRWQGLIDRRSAMMERASMVLARAKDRMPHPLVLLARPATIADHRWAARDAARRDFPTLFDRPRRRARPARPGERIRLGYIGSYFKNHALAVALPQLLRSHDRSRFSVFAYSTSAAWNDQIEASVDRLTDIADLAPKDQAARLAADGIDIAIDLDGYLGLPLALFAHGPAPVTVNYFGYPGGCGGVHDYIVADPVVIPPFLERYYDEKVIRLPHCYLPIDTSRPITCPAGDRAAFGLPSGAVVYLAFHSMIKITPDAFAVWMAVLRQVPEAVLWLLDHGERESRNLAESAALFGIDPRRLVFAAKTGNLEHIARLALADIYLDTPHFNAHTTGSDALWMGVPIVTVEDQPFAARVGASMLAAVGLGELVGRDLDDMAAIAVRLGRDAAWRKEIKTRLAAARETAPLFDAAGYAEALDRAFETMAARARAGLEPAGFDLEARERRGDR